LPLDVNFDSRRVFRSHAAVRLRLLFDFNQQIEKEAIFMTKINLREQYPDLYTSDYIVEVPDEVADFMRECDRKEAAYRRRTRYHKVFYSLDCDPAEQEALFVSMSTDEIYERKVTMEQLHQAMATLSDKQAKRVYARFFLGLSEAAIAKSEGVSAVAINKSIHHGLKHIEKILKNFL
jgi:RNA polymerase sigma-70 factor (ECF subfamily)